MNNPQFTEQRTIKNNILYFARVDSYELIEGVAYYDLSVLGNFGTKKTQMRYSNFEKIHDTLSQQIKQLQLNIKLPNFPRKNLIQRTNQSEQFIFVRMNRLAEYFNRLLTIQDLQDFPLVRSLLPPNIISDSFAKLIPTLQSESQYYREDIFDKERSWKEMEKLKSNLKDKCIQEQAQTRGFKQVYSFDIQLESLPTCRYKPQINYLITIRNLDSHEQWTFKTRYSRLRIFHKALKRENLNIPLPVFPKRNVLLQTNINYELLELRVQGILNYLERLFCLKQVLENDIAQHFLNYSQRNCEEYTPDFMEQFINILGSKRPSKTAKSFECNVVKRDHTQVGKRTV